MSPSQGTFFSGETLAGFPVTFECTDGLHLRVSIANETKHFPLAGLQVSDRLGQVPRFIYLPGRAVIETADNAAVDRWLAASRRGRLTRVIHTLESHLGVAVAACVLVVSFIVVGLYFGPPRVARAIAMRVPSTIEERAGKVTLASIDQYYGPSLLQKPERNRVEAQLTRVLGSHPGIPRPRLEFRQMGVQPNAFALPGGIIVVADEFVRLPATDDEIAAVLAHEVGHLEKRHGLQTVLRNSLALLFVSGVTGDLSVLTSFAAALPFTILTQGYARDLEREADTYALATLRECGLPPKSFSRALYKLRHSVGATPGTSSVSYLSTHPSDEERMAQFGRLTSEEEKAVDVEMKQQLRITAPAIRTAPLPDTPQKTRRTPRDTSPKSHEAVDEAPRILVRTDPVYPEAARKGGRSGDVEVNFLVEADGSVVNPYAVKSSDPIFESAAVEAVQHWRFKAGRKGGKPVPVHMHVPIIFELKQATAADPVPPPATTTEGEPGPGRTVPPTE